LPAEKLHGSQNSSMFACCIWTEPKKKKQMTSDDTKDSCSTEIKATTENREYSTSFGVYDSTCRVAVTFKMLIFFII